MKKHRITITSHRNNVVGRLQAHDTDTGATLYQVDGPYKLPGSTGRYRVLGLRSELVAHSLVGSLAHARETIRLDDQTTTHTQKEETWTPQLPPESKRYSARRGH